VSFLGTLANNAAGSLQYQVWRLFRPRVNIANRRRLSNQSPTIISSNCIGGVILHDLGLPFLTPTINMFMSTHDFVKFARYLDSYIGEAGSLAEIDNGGRSYPMGRLGDIDIHFVHYPDFATAKTKWCERSMRIRHDNIFIMATNRDGCARPDMDAFESLPYANKVMFTNRPFQELPSTFYIPGFEGDGEVGDLTRISGLLGRRFVDSFDYVSFLNRKG
jgi:uncharacterized protein (DUF1919 family)